jgi:ATP-dependent protease HslVU (ClpYQ) peptidase subunit
MRISISIVFLIFFLLLNGCGGGGGGGSSTTTTTTTTTTTYTYTVTTFAGTGSSGFVNGTGTAASFNAPDSLVSDTSGNIFVVDTTNSAIRKITSSQVVTTFATLTTGSGIAIDSSGNLFVSSGGIIKKITSSGVSSTFAGSTTTGNTDGTGTAAAFSSIWGMTVDSSDNVYVADAGNHNIRKITSSGVVTTFAGSTAGTSGSANGTGTAATFYKPAALAFDSSSNLFVSEFGNHMIRKITSTGVVTTFAGSTTSGSADGTGTAASFSKPLGLVIDSTDSIYVVDQNNNMVRKVTSAGVVTTIIGTTTSGNTNGVGTSALLNTPNGIAKDSSGSLYISDYGNNLIRKVAITTTTTTN